MREISENLWVAETSLRFLGIEVDIVAIEEQKVLAFDIENDRLGVGGLAPKDA